MGRPDRAHKVQEREPISAPLPSLLSRSSCPPPSLSSPSLHRIHPPPSSAPAPPSLPCSTDARRLLCASAPPEPPTRSPAVLARSGFGRFHRTPVPSGDQNAESARREIPRLFCGWPTTLSRRRRPRLRACSSMSTSSGCPPSRTSTSSTRLVTARPASSHSPSRAPSTHSSPRARPLTPVVTTRRRHGHARRPRRLLAPHTLPTPRIPRPPTRSNRESRHRFRSTRRGPALSCTWPPPRASRFPVHPQVRARARARRAPLTPPDGAPRGASPRPPRVRLT